MNEQALQTAWADDLVRLETRLREVESERDTYRELTCALLDVAHRVTCERDQLRDRLAALLDQRRSSTRQDSQAA